jgi:hypothetical protein
MQMQSREDDMDCCGHALAARQWMWSTALTSVGAMLASGNYMRIFRAVVG